MRERGIWPKGKFLQIGNTSKAWSQLSNYNLSSFFIFLFPVNWPSSMERNRFVEEFPSYSVSDLWKHFNQYFKFQLNEKI